MLFNSYEFIFVFLPTVFLLYWTCGKYLGFKAALSALTLGSFFFYAWWNPPYFIIFFFSIVTNFFLGRGLSAVNRHKKLLLVLGICFNLSLLGYYKYANFFMDQVAGLFNYSFIRLDILLPIGISFYTFQQIAFLVDSYKEKTSYSFTNYCLFVSFFPQLIAGPIVHHAEMMPQFKNKSVLDNLQLYPTAIMFFVIGLFKKVVIADNLSLFASPIFLAVDSGAEITFFESWMGMLAYSFQLYFDFSGYTDMAIGLALLFGIQLPINFNSPYKSRSIVDFWRRWHMTLSKFLRDYLYIPLGGNKHGEFNRYRNLLLTMVIGGLWHGAGWGFLLWGALHGIYLVVNHLLAPKIFPRISFIPKSGISAICLVITFFCVVFAWVPFRATTLSGVLELWSSMFLHGEVGLPPNFLGLLGLSVNPEASWAFLFNGDLIISPLEWLKKGIFLVLIALLIAFFAPNSQSLVSKLKELMSMESKKAKLTSSALGFITAVVFLISISRLNSATEFMYFQF